MQRPWGRIVPVYSREEQGGLPSRNESSRVVKGRRSKVRGGGQSCGTFGSKENFGFYSEGDGSHVRVLSEGVVWTD